MRALAVNYARARACRLFITGGHELTGDYQWREKQRVSIVDVFGYWNGWLKEVGLINWTGVVVSFFGR